MAGRAAAIVNNNLFLVLLLVGVTSLAITAAMKTIINDSQCAESVCRMNGAGNLDACFNGDFLYCCGETGDLSCGSYSKCERIGSYYGLTQCSVIRIVSWITLSIGALGLIGSIVIAWKTNPNNQGFSPFTQNQIHS